MDGTDSGDKDGSGLIGIPVINQSTDVVEKSPSCAPGCW